MCGLIFSIKMCREGYRLECLLCLVNFCALSIRCVERDIVLSVLCLVNFCADGNVWLFSIRCVERDIVLSVLCLVNFCADGNVWLFSIKMC